MEEFLAFSVFAIALALLVYGCFLFNPYLAIALAILELPFWWTYIWLIITLVTE